MTTEPLIACSLSSSDQAERFDLAADLQGRALIESESIKGGLRLVFANEPGIQDELKALVEAESKCCSFLDFHLLADEQTLVLEVTGPDAADPVIHSLFAPEPATGHNRCSH